MNLREFRQAGHWPTLLSAFLYFDVSFMVWVLVGALGNTIAAEFELSDAEKGLLVAVPLLGGAVLRLVLGVMTDSLGARRTAIAGLAATVVPLLLGWLWADTYLGILLVGLLLGVAGASFAAALPLAGRWYPPQYQGLVMGIAGAGNSGTALAALFAPRLAEVFTWQAVFGLALIPVLSVLALLILLAREAPKPLEAKPLIDYARVLREADTWWFCLFYSVTFGGFVGLASFLSIYFHTHHGLSRVDAGAFATVCVLAGSFLRPVGGRLADRIGGIQLLTFLYVGIALLLLDLATAPPLPWATVLLFVILGMLGMGNGAVFQLVPQRFGREIGVITGIVGAAGGVGGFFLPTVLGSIKQLTGSYSIGFLLFALVCLICMAVLVNAARVWEGTFVGKGGIAAPSLAGSSR